MATAAGSAHHVRMTARHDGHAVIEGGGGPVPDLLGVRLSRLNR